MNRRSFLGIISVGVACPLSLLKAKPYAPFLRHSSNLTQKQLADLMREAFKNTRFTGYPVWFSRMEPGTPGHIVIYDGAAPHIQYVLLQPEVCGGKL